MLVLVVNGKEWSVDPLNEGGPGRFRNLLQVVDAAHSEQDTYMRACVYVYIHMTCVYTYIYIHMYSHLLIYTTHRDFPLSMFKSLKAQ